MDFHPDLFRLPSDTSQIGGAGYEIATPPNIKAGGDSINTFESPTVLVKKAVSFAHIDSLAEIDYTKEDTIIANFLAVNGGAVENSLKSKDFTDISQYMFLGERDYDSLNGLLGEQLVFLIMFSQFWFLACVEAKTSALFSADFNKKFNEIRNLVESERRATPTVLLGQSIANWETYYTTTRDKYIPAGPRRKTYARFIEIFISGPERMLTWFAEAQARLEGNTIETSSLSTRPTEHGFRGMRSAGDEGSNGEESSNNNISNTESEAGNVDRNLSEFEGNAPSADNESVRIATEAAAAAAEMNTAATTGAHTTAAATTTPATAAAGAAGAAATTAATRTAAVTTTTAARSRSPAAASASAASASRGVPGSRAASTILSRLGTGSSRPSDPSGSTVLRRMGTGAATAAAATVTGTTTGAAAASPPGSTAGSATSRRTHFEVLGQNKDGRNVSAGNNVWLEPNPTTGRTTRKKARIISYEDRYRRFKTTPYFPDRDPPVLDTKHPVHATSRYITKINSTE